MKKFLAMILAVLMLALCGCASGAGDTAQTAEPTADTAQTQDAEEPAQEVQYEYQLKAGETMEVYDKNFEEMVTVTLDPASTRNAAIELRSNMVFDNCVFNGGLTIVGDYHAMISLGPDCTFGEGTVVTCQETTPGVTRDMTLDDNYAKIFVGCEGVAVETESSFGVVTDGPDFVFNGTTYSKAELAPDADYMGVYSLYEGDSMTYVKLALGEDNSVEFLD